MAAVAATFAVQTQVADDMARNGILMPDGRVLKVGTPEWLAEGSRRMTLLLDAQMRVLPPGALQSPLPVPTPQGGGSPASSFSFGSGSISGAPSPIGAAGAGAVPPMQGQPWAPAANSHSSGGGGAGETSGNQASPNGSASSSGSGGGGGGGELASNYAQSIKSFNVKRKLSNAATPTVTSRKDLQSPLRARSKGAPANSPPRPPRANVAPLQRAFQGLSFQGGFGAMPTIVATSYSSDGSGATSSGHPSPSVASTAANNASSADNSNANSTSAAPSQPSNNNQFNAPQLPLVGAMSFDLGITGFGDIGDGACCGGGGNGGAGPRPELLPSMSEVLLDLDYNEMVPPGHGSTPRQVQPLQPPSQLGQQGQQASEQPRARPPPLAPLTVPPQPKPSASLGIFPLAAEPSPTTWDNMAGAVAPGQGWTTDGRVPLNDGTYPNNSGADDAATQAAKDAARRKARGSYACSKCGQPKKGHVCSLGDDSNNNDGTGEDDGLDMLLGSEGLLENDPWASSGTGDGFGGFEGDALFDDALALALGDAALLAGGNSEASEGLGEAGQAGNANTAKKPLRTAGGYRCSRCGLPKKGHVCAFGDD
jgi:DNA-directed RNA polymerase subunit RPC12/RpoP